MTTQRFKVSRAEQIEALRRQLSRGALGHVGMSFPEPEPIKVRKAAKATSRRRTGTAA